MDVNPITSAPSHMQLARKATAEEIVYYIHREIIPELRLLRGLVGLMLSAGEEDDVRFGDDLHLGTVAPSALFVRMDTTPALLDRQVRTIFDPSKYPGANLSKTRNIYIEYWISASGGGGSPEVALFNEDTGFEVSGSRQAHTDGTTSTGYLVGPLEVGEEDVQLSPTGAVYEIMGRDPDAIVNPVLGQARFIVRYE